MRRLLCVCPTLLAVTQAAERGTWLCVGTSAASLRTAWGASGWTPSAVPIRSLKELDISEGWSGEIPEPGTLRLCVTGGPALLVYAENLKEMK